MAPVSSAKGGRMRKHVKGTVATYQECINGKMTMYIRPLKIIKNYIGWNNKPCNWNDMRANELSALMSWVYENLDDDAVKEQLRLENRE